MSNFLPSCSYFQLRRAAAGLLLGSALSCLSTVAMEAAAAAGPETALRSNQPMLAQSVTVIQRGSSGDLVTELQRRLSELGFYDGPISGFFGELTEAAVIRFQQDQGLVGDGIVGVSTAEALRGIGTRDTTAALQRGDQGDRVSQLQRRLTELGFYDGPISGFFGELTEAAVIQFQTDQSLAVDGIVGASTEAALSDSIASQSSTGTGRTPDPTDGLLERSEVGEAVTELQQRLADLAYYDGPIDGRYGPLTEAAVSQFQSDNSLTVDGITGPATLAAISEATANGADTAQTPAPDPAPAEPTPAAAAPAREVGTTDPQTELVPIQPASPIVPTETAIVLPIRVELSPEDIRTIQARLQDRGFYDGPIDGVLNDATRQAIAAAQQAYEISPGDLVFND